MKKIMWALLLVTASLHAQNKDAGFVINGKIKGLGNDKVYFFYVSDNKRIRDSVTAADNKFVYKGKLSEPSMITMTTPKFKKPAEIFAENAEMTVKGNIKSFNEITVWGSDAHDGYAKLSRKLRNVRERQEKAMEEYRARDKAGNTMTEDEAAKLFDPLEKEEKDIVKQFAADNPTKLASAYALYRQFSYDPPVEEVEPIFNAFSDALKKSSFGKNMSANLETAKKTAVGKMALDFTQNDMDGNPLALSSFRGKYLLVDFWASWCGPCRSENPNVVKSYNAYHGKGFEILGVSLDTDKEKWFKAINDDKLKWSHVSDLKGWKNEVATQYGIRAIPANFLLDPTGKIIGRNLRGDKLEKKLAEVFGPAR